MTNCTKGTYTEYQTEFYKRAKTEQMSSLTFAQILEVLKHVPEAQAARSGWNGKGLTIKMQKPDAGSKMTLPYIYIEYPEASAERGNPIYPVGCRCPWLASQSDIIAEDWTLI